jgi:hypothetical protein
MKARAVRRESIPGCAVRVKSAIRSYVKRSRLVGHAGSDCRALRQQANLPPLPAGDWLIGLIVPPAKMFALDAAA